MTIIKEYRNFIQYRSNGKLFTCNSNFHPLEVEKFFLKALTQARADERKKVKEKVYNMVLDKTWDRLDKYLKSK